MRKRYLQRLWMQVLNLHKNSQNIPKPELENAHEKFVRGWYTQPFISIEKIEDGADSRKRAKAFPIDESRSEESDNIQEIEKTKVSDNNARSAHVVNSATNVKVEESERKSPKHQSKRARPFLIVKSERQRDTMFQMKISQERLKKPSQPPKIERNQLIVKPKYQGTKFTDPLPNKKRKSTAKRINQESRERLIPPKTLKASLALSNEAVINKPVTESILNTAQLAKLSITKANTPLRQVSPLPKIEGYNSDIPPQKNKIVTINEIKSSEIDFNITQRDISPIVDEDCVQLDKFNDESHLDDIMGLDEANNQIESSQILNVVDISGDKSTSEDKTNSSTPTLMEKKFNYSSGLDKTPLEMESIFDDPLNYDDDDDDVISVATSWDGFDDIGNISPTERDEKLSKESGVNMAKKSPNPSQNLKNFRIPKQKQVLTTNEQVIESPLEKSNHEKPDQIFTKRSNPFSTAKAPVSTKRSSNTSSTSNTKTITFPPLYRIQSEEENTRNTIEANATISIYESSHWSQELFGIRCYHHLDYACNRTNCPHFRVHPNQLQVSLCRLDDYSLHTAYKYIKRSRVLFQDYAIVFAQVFASRKMKVHLVHMIYDCNLYKSICSPIIEALFQILINMGVEPNEAISYFMKHLWMPCSSARHPNVTLAILGIMISCNWFVYKNELLKLFGDYMFPIPKGYLKVLFDHALAKDDMLAIKTLCEVALACPLDSNSVEIQTLFYRISENPAITEKIMLDSDFTSLKERYNPIEQQNPNYHLTPQTMQTDQIPTHLEIDPIALQQPNVMRHARSLNELQYHPRNNLNRN